MTTFHYMQNPDGGVHQTTNPDWHPELKKITRAEGQRLMKEQSRTDLRKILKPKDRIYTVLRKVSASGMSRHISFLIVDDGELQSLDWSIGQALGLKMAEPAGLKIDGCGMDMGFATVYNLGRALWPNGTPEPHSSRNGEPDNDGGYALKHEWI